MTEMTGYIPRLDALGQFKGVYHQWQEACVKGGDSEYPGSVLVTGFGLAGKTTFLENDVKGLFREVGGLERVANPSPTEAFIHIDYDAFDSYPTMLKVLLATRAKLAEHKVKTPWLDRGLDEYRRRVDPTAFDEKDIGKLDMTDAIVNNVASFVAAYLAFQPNPSTIETISAVLGVAAAVLSAAALARDLQGPLSRSHTRVKAGSFLSQCRDEDILGYLPAFLAQDLYRADKTETMVCLALDGIGGAIGAQESDWELRFARGLSAGDTGVLTMLSARSFPEQSITNAREGRRLIDLDVVSEETMGSIIEDYGPKDLDSTIERFLYEGGQDGGPVSPGLACLCLSTASLGSDASKGVTKALATKDDAAKTLTDYGEEYLRGRIDRNPDRLEAAEAMESLIGRILSVQLEHLSCGQAQAVYVMSFFNSVDLSRLVSQIDILTGHPRSVWLCRHLPYIVRDKGAQWYVHSTIARLARMACDPLTVDLLSLLLEKALSSSSSGLKAGEAQVARMVLVRLAGSVFFRKVMEVTGADTPVHLPEVTLPGALEAWLDYLVRSAKVTGGKDMRRCNIAFRDLLRAYARWNRSTWTHEAPDAVKRANELVKVGRKLLDVVKQGDLPGIDEWEATVMLADLLTHLGAAESQLFLRESNIEHHHEALSHECEALRLRVGLSDPLREPGLANNINSVAVSSYRLMGYEYSLPLHVMAIKAYRLWCGKTGGYDGRLLGRLLRAFAATLFSCAKDVNSSTFTVPPVWGLSKEETMEALLRDAETVCLAAKKADSKQAWRCEMTRAECITFSGDHDGGIEVLESVWAEIAGKIAEGKVGQTAPVATRCQYLLARAYQARGKSGDLKVALEYARKAYEGRHSVNPNDKDTQKSKELVEAIEADLGGNKPVAARHASTDDRSLRKDEREGLTVLLREVEGLVYGLIGVSTDPDKVFRSEKYEETLDWAKELGE